MLILHCKGGGGTVEDNTYPTGPWEPQIPYVNKLFSEGNSLYDGGGPQYFDGNTQAGTSTRLKNSLDSMMDYSRYSQKQTNAGMEAAQGLTSSVGQSPFQQAGAQASGQIPGLIGATAGVGGAQQGLYNQVGGGVAGALNSNLSASQGGYQNFSPDQTQAAQQNLNPYLQNALSGQGTMNPYLDQMVQDQARSATRGFNDNVMPALANSAVDAGQPGGSRQGIAQGIAASRLGEDISSITNQLYSQAFDNAQQQQQFAAGMVGDAQGQGAANQLQGGQLSIQDYLGRGGLGNQAAGIGSNVLNQAGQTYGSAGGLAGQVGSAGGAQGLQQSQIGLGAMPGLLNAGNQGVQTGNQAGQQQQALNQGRRDASVDRWNYNQNLDFQNLQAYQSFINGPYGSSVSGAANTASNPFATLEGQAAMQQGAGGIPLTNQNFQQYFGLQGGGFGQQPNIAALT